MIFVPAFRYYGGKASLTERLVGLMPQEGDVYVEPFAGLGNVFWRTSRLLKFKAWWINDLLRWNFFLALYRTGYRFKMTYDTDFRRLYRHYEKEYFDTGSDESEILQWYLSFNGAGFAHGGARGTYSGGVSAHTYDRCVHVSSHILYATNATITGFDWTEPLKDLGPADFVFLDPPYLGCDVGAYSEATVDYCQMFAILKRARFRWMLTHYANALFEQELGKPNYTISVKRRGALRCATGRADSGRLECIWWRNYSPKDSRTSE